MSFIKNAHLFYNRYYDVQNNFGEAFTNNILDIVRNAAPACYIDIAIYINCKRFNLQDVCQKIARRISRYLSKKRLFIFGNIQYICKDN